MIHARLQFLALALVSVVAVPAAAQQTQARPAGAGTVRVVPTDVSRVTLVRVKPGQGPAFDRDVLNNLIPIYEEFKKAGIIVSYAFFSNLTSDGPDDWNVGSILTYANMAALDNLGDRTDPITLKHYGSADKRTQAGNARNDLRTVVSSELMRSLSYRAQ